MRFYFFIILLFPTMLFSAPDKVKSKAGYPTKKWIVADPSKAKMDTILLARADSEVRRNQPSVKGILVTRNGKIVYEKYYGGFRQDSMYNIWSITKSVMSMLTGIALKDCIVDDLDQQACALMPTQIVAGIHSTCKDVTLANLMTMTSGLSWFKPGTSVVIRRYDEMDQIFASPVTNFPGDMFRYDGANPHAVSILLQNRACEPLNKFAEDNLFKPLGIDHYKWEQDNSGYYLGSEGLYLTARDLAKLGYLMMKNGKWEGNQIIPRDYVATSTTERNPGGYPGNDAYGYFWWVSKTASAETYYALGSGGLLLVVTPSLGLVSVIITDPNHPLSDLYKPREAYLNYILPAAK